jgi:serine/threonine protein kinase
MEELPDKRTLQVSEDVPFAKADERTVEFERETIDNESPKLTNDSSLQADPGSQNTEAYLNDYERALPRHYKLIRLLGRGGMAEVFLALDERLNRSVAIKFLNSEFRRDPERMRRFLGEARAASALNHPNILIIHDIGENEGVQYIVSEYVQGDTLTALIRRRELSMNEAINVTTQIASALSASHRAGIVHRDIKPDNIMVRRDGSVKVLDFGLAKETGENLYGATGFEAQTLEGVATSPGLILGTPQYMSPEQARGQRLDARTDIFSLGIILYELVSGEPPFPGGSMVDVIAAILGKDPRKISEIVEVPEGLEKVVERSLQKDRSERYQTIDEMLSDLRSLRSDSGVGSYNFGDTKKEHARSTRENSVSSLPAQRSVPWKLIIFAAIAIPVLFLIVNWYGNRQSVSVSSAPMRSNPITNWSSNTGELVAAASFSPDAKMIAFAATKTGATEIWTKPVTGGEPIPVTKSGFYNQYPVWSPNGQEIAFFSSRSGSRGIWRVSFAGGEQVQITSGIGASARPILWSESGKIIFQDGNELWSADERSGERAKLTDFEVKKVTPRTIQLSRDGSTLAYSVRDGEQWKVMIADLNQIPGQQVASSRDQIDQIAWDPNGKTVVYSSAANGAYQVYRTGIGYESPVALSNGDNDLFVQDVSSDGASILYGSVNETSDLWTVNVSDGKQAPAVNDVAAEFWAEFSPDGKSLAYQSVAQPDRPYRGSVKSVAAGSSDPIVISPEGFSPTWSNDGRWIAYFRRSEAGISIWKARSTGADAQRIADGFISPPGYLATPYLKIGTGHISWSPDNSQIAYLAKQDDRMNIWIAAVDGSRNAAVSANADQKDVLCCPHWMPDGKSIVYASDLPKTEADTPGKSRLTSVDAATSTMKILFETPERFRFLGLAADGKTALLAVRSDARSASMIPDSTDIYEVSLQTGSKTKVNTLSNAYFHNIHLSSDGRSIAFVSRKDDVSAIWNIPVRGGSPKQLVVENDPKILISGLAWSPAGDNIVFGKQTRTNMLSMLSN